MSPRSDQPDYDPRELRSPQPFIELMALERLDDASPTSDQPEKVKRFKSLAAPFSAGEGMMGFGGHCYAQSAYAASKTVGKEFLIHVCPEHVQRGSAGALISVVDLQLQDMTGTFVLPGLLDRPYIYSVRHIRDGSMYCTRAVEARQDGKICFTGLCSLKRREAERFNHQPSDAHQRFKSILDGKRPEDYPPSPGVDADWWDEYAKAKNIAEREFPGVDVRKVDMKDYNQTEEVKRCPEKFRQLQLYSFKGSPEKQPTTDLNDIKAKEQSGEYDNLYACAHMYASDKNSLLLIPRALGHPMFTALASLTLTVVFHEHGEALRMMDWDGSTESMESLPKKWFLQEAWTPSSGDNRAIHESYLWSREGKLLATTMQDSLLRLPKVDRERKL